MHESSIRSLRQRLGLMLSLRQIVLGTTAFAFVWGTVVLAVRVGSGGRPDWLTWGLIALPILAIVAIVRGVRQVPSPQSVRALVDRASHQGGLLMASDEHPLGDWSRQLRGPASLSVRWNARRGLGLLATATAFLLVAFLFPQRLASWQGGGLDVGEDVQQLIAKIDLLKEEKAIDPKRAEFLSEKLEQVREDAKGRDPAKTHEALDHVRDQLMKSAQQAAQSAMKKNEKMGQAEALAKALHKAGDAANANLQKEAMAELAALVQAAAEEGALLDKNIDADLMQSLQDLNLTPEELMKLAEALKGAKGELAEGFGKLAKARLIDAETLKKICKAGECKGDGECEGEECVIAALALCKRGGVGGLTRGPGHNPITWTEGTNEENVKFKEIVLPPSNLQKSKIVGVGKAEPQKGDVSVSAGGALDRGNAGGGGSNVGQLLPQHRAAVERFFRRDSK